MATYRRLVLTLLAAGLALQALAFVNANVGGVHLFGRRMPTIASHTGARWHPSPGVAFLADAGRRLPDAPVIFDDVSLGDDTYDSAAFAYELYPRRRFSAPPRTPLVALVRLARARGARYVLVRRRRVPRGWRATPGLRPLRQSECCLLAEVEPAP